MAKRTRSKTQEKEDKRKAAQMMADFQREVEAGHQQRVKVRKPRPSTVTKAKTRAEGSPQAEGPTPPQTPRAPRSGPGDGITPIKSIQELKAIAMELASEATVNNRKLERGVKSRAVHILLDLAESQFGADKKVFLEYAFGSPEVHSQEMLKFLEKILTDVDLEKLSPQQIDDLSKGKPLIEVLLADYLSKSSSR